MNLEQLEQKTEELFKLIKTWMTSPHGDGYLREELSMFLEDFNLECKKEIPNETANHNR